jgi:threonine dehydrogenase-like Zn-dependent dehydrogenase
MDFLIFVVVCFGSARAPFPIVPEHCPEWEKLRDMTGGRGAGYCIDAVGMEAHGATLDALNDRIKTAVMLETDRSHALRAAIFA